MHTPSREITKRNAKINVSLRVPSLRSWWHALGMLWGSKRATGASEKLRPEAPGSGFICGAT